MSDGPTTRAGFAAELTCPEALEGALCGCIRQVQNVYQKDRKPAHGAGDQKDWQINVEGALGERAFCKWLGIYHSGAYEFRGMDAGAWQVRTAAEHGHRLILHREDANADAFVLLTGVNGRYVVRGFILGRDGKNEKYWGDPSGKNRPAFWVPQKDLISPARISAEGPLPREQA